MCKYFFGVCVDGTEGKSKKAKGKRTRIKKKDVGFAFFCLLP